MLGFDISHQNGIIDFAKQKARGVEFVFLKATEGTGFTDNKYAYNVAQAIKAGILNIGAYHFFHANLDPVDQADFFIKTAWYLPSTVPKAMVLDWEVSDNMRPSIQKQRALQFLRVVQGKIGRPPILYSSPGFLNTLGDLSAFANYPLWIAEYGVTSPKRVLPWVSHTFWQYSDGGGMDLDSFDGTPEELKAYFS